MKSSKSTTPYITTLAIILVFITTILTTAAFALQEDFEAWGEKEIITACACDLTTDRLTVSNTGDITSTFMLDVTGSAAEWTNLAPQSFYIDGGESKTVDRFIKIPCSARGIYELNTTIRTVFDLEKNLQQALDVQNCQNVQVIPKFDTDQESCPCTPVQYSFEVINTGNHVETYEISVEPYSDLISLGTDIVILEPGQKETVDVFINLECGEYGDRVFTFNAKAQGTEILAQSDFALTINKCYEYDLVAGDSYKVCQGVPNVIPFQIQNNATVGNEYFISVTGTEWAYAENASISAWGGEIKEGNILVFPPNDEEGTKTITLTTTATRGEESRSKDIVLETEKCYDYQLIEPENFNAIQCKQKEHVFTLKNIGSRPATYDVEVEGVEWLSTNSLGILLQPDEETIVMVSGEAPCDATGDFTEQIYVTIEDINQTYLEDNTVSVFTKEDAYIPKIELSDINTDYAGSQTPVKITNTGFETATYDLSLAASNWMSLDAASIEIAPGESKEFILISTPGEDVIEDKYTGEIIAAVRGQDIEYSTDFLVEVSTSNGLPLWVIASMAGGAVLLLILIIIIILATRKKKTNTEEKKEEKKIEKDSITIDKKEYRRQKKEEKKKGIVWPFIIISLILLGLAGAAYYAYSSDIVSSMLGGENNETTEESLEAVPEEILETPSQTEEKAPEMLPTPAPEETENGILTNEDISESLITIDRSSVAGNGNKLQLTNETILNLPVSITNPTDRKAVFSVNTTQDSWVKFDKEKVTVMPNATSVITLTITPDLDALKENDYSVIMNTVLEGKKIHYEETLEIVLTTKTSPMSQYWPWIIVGLIGLLILILFIKLATRPKKTAIIKTEKIAKKEKISQKEKPSKKGEKSSGHTGAIVAIVILLILVGLGFWAYNMFISGNATADAEQTEETSTENQTETTPQNATFEDKLTNEDVSESLITIDRSGIPGEDTTLNVEQESYQLPLSIHNPTDRKARFTVNTSNESWITFDRYKIIVTPNSTETTNMTLTPDYDALKTNDYMININTKLEGDKIDYQEQLGFKVTKKRLFELSYIAYVLAGLGIIALIIVISEIARRNKGNNKTKTTKTAKPTASSKKKKKEVKEKSLESINKEIAALRKSTVLKLKNS